MNKILVIDDNEVGNFLVKLNLEESQCECAAHFCEDGQSGLDYLLNVEHFPNVIFLDINMPGIDGWDFLDAYGRLEYNERHADTLIFMLSTSVYQQDKDKSKLYSYVTDYIEKPLNTEKIIAIKEEYFPDEK